MSNNRVSFRYDIKPTTEQIEDAQKNVTIFAPEWVKEALDQLQTKLHGQKFQVFHTGQWDAVYTQFQISQDANKPISLAQLQMMARNEPSNTTGGIDWDRYSNGIPPEVILALKDLVRQCVLIGLCETVKYGGYPPESAAVPQKAPVYVIDLAALQFQEPENTGRLVLSSAAPKVGILDRFIFWNVVREVKPSFQEVRKFVQEGCTRFVRCEGDMHETYFDTLAYQRFVTSDVILTARALCHFAGHNRCGNGICFKFLKYGTGYFAAQYGDILEKYLLPAVIEGIMTAVREDRGNTIKSLEFPFYTEPEPNSEMVKALEKLKTDFNVTYKFSENDALKASDTGYVTAVTNCADPHAGFGNEMQYGSVDGAIAESLKTKGVEFFPALNKLMMEMFI